MTADTITAIKKADNAPDRIWATVNGMSTRVPDGVRQLVGGWSQDADRAGAVEYVRASTLESLQRENAALKKDRYDLAYAITGGEDAPGLLDSTPTSEIVEIAQHAHRMHRDDIDRAEAAEAEVKRLREELQKISATVPSGHLDFRKPKHTGYEALEIARAALASTGGEHHAE